jgi:outer membrane protein assembly factor BamA
MRCIFTIWSLLISLNSFTQKYYSINFNSTDYQLVDKSFSLLYKDSSKAAHALENFAKKALKKGYVLSSIDSIKYSFNNANISFYTGSKFKKIEISTNVKTEELTAIKPSFKEKMLLKVPFRPREIQALIEQIQNNYLNAGFPFCKIYLDSLNVKSQIPHAELNIETGRRYLISDIIVKGDSTISPTLISMITGLQKGDLYNHEVLKNINNAILQQAYIEQIKPEEFLFKEEGLEIYLYLKAKGISSINGAIGLQPNPNNSKISLTGEINLKLVNILRRSESFQLNWRNIQSQTQALSTALTLPYLFKSPFGIDAQFNLYKRDSTFIELRSLAGINYSLRNGLNVKAYYQNFSSNILASGNSSNVFQNLSNVRTNSYGLGVSRRSLDYIPNPTKGFSFNSDITFGNRKSRLNDTLEWLSNTTYKVSLYFDWYIPIYKRNVIKFSNKSDFYYAPEVFQNELFRFGGLQTLRGFNEEELFASSKSIFSIEYRFLLDKNSAIFAFYDQGIYENNSVSYKRDTPFGFGGGLSFGTNLGIFSISLALGKQYENPVLLRNSKIHFGYIAYF